MGYQMLFSHFWNKCFCAGIKKVSSWCCSSPVCPNREVQASRAWPLSMLGPVPRIPKVVQVDGRRYCLSLPGFPGRGREIGSINEGKVYRALPSRSLWVGNYRLCALDAPELGWRFSRKQPQRRAVAATLSTPGLLLAAQQLTSLSSSQLAALPKVSST